MKSLLTLLLCFTAVLATAQDSFPGLKQVMTKAEWERAGLDRLTPDELGVIEAAFIRYHVSTTTQLKAEVTTARQSAAAATAAAASTTSGPSVATLSTPGAQPPKGWLERFGLPVYDRNDWRSLPPLRAKVAKWDGGNRFVLDNGQIWEGFEAITYDLPGKQIEIQARPNGQFALVVEGLNTTLRVMRLR